MTTSLVPLSCKKCTDGHSLRGHKRKMTCDNYSKLMWLKKKYHHLHLVFVPIKKCERNLKNKRKKRSNKSLVLTGSHFATFWGLKKCISCLQNTENSAFFVLGDSVEQPTPSSLQRGFWPTSWGSCWWFSGCCWSTWSPRTSTDVRRTRRKRLCLSTSRPSQRGNPRLRPDQGEKAWPWLVDEDLGSPFVQRSVQNYHHLSIHFVVNVSFNQIPNTWGVRQLLRLLDDRPPNSRCVKSELLLTGLFFNGFMVYFRSSAKKVWLFHLASLETHPSHGCRK